LADLAQHGLLVAVSGPLYKDMRMSGRFNAQRYIKDFTRHNDKLGFDFKNKERKYEASLSDQFSASTYPGFLRTASAFYNSKGDEKLRDYFDAASQKFVINPAKMQTIMNEQGRAVLVPDEVQHSRTIQGLRE